MNTGAGRARAAETWLRFRELVRAAGVDLAAGQIVRGAGRELADELVAAYDAPFPTPESKAGVLAFPEHVPIEPEHPNTAPMMAFARRSRAGRSLPLLFADSDLIFPPWSPSGSPSWIPARCRPRSS